LSLELLPAFVRDTYEIHEWRHASAVLSVDFPQEWADILAVLAEFRLYRSEVATPGGGRSPIAIRIDGHFAALGWRERGFKTRVVVDEMEYSAPTHKVDNFKGGVAADLEWNNRISLFQGSASTPENLTSNTG
jgi:Restriction endonuclease BglII